MSRAKGPGQNRYNKHWQDQNGKRIANLETEAESSAGISDKNKHLFNRKLATKNNPHGIDHQALRR